MKSVASKTVNEATVENVTEAVKKPKIAVVGVKKGAIAAKETATKIAFAPSKLLDRAIYGACYGVSYGAVFTSLMIVKMLPVNGMAMKGFHDGAKVARKSYKAGQEKQEMIEGSAAVAETLLK